MSGRSVARVFMEVGYAFSHQNGSHMIYRRSEPPHRHLSIPDHKELRPGTLRSLIRESGLTMDQFIQIAKS